ncbi:MAG: glycosyltransferase family 1 protein [Verrucomicrobiota bacterium]
MRIGIDSNVFTMQKYGGVSRYLVRLGEELMQTGNAVRVFGWLHTNRHLTESGRRLTGMRYVNRFPRFTRRLAHQVGDLLTGWEMQSWKPDLIHESFCHARRVGPGTVPRVCTIHDLIHELFPQYWGRMDRTPEYRRKTLERCQAVICVSESTRRDLLKVVEVDPAKVHVVHHGFDHMSRVGGLTPAEEDELAGAGRAPYLLYVGARHGYKNFQGFLRGLALSAVRHDFRVVAFGGGAWTGEESALIKQLGFAAGQVVQLGGSDALLHELFCGASAFVYPSFYEGFGFPPLEAMARGCPVIASNASSMPEVIGTAAEFFDPSDIPGIGAALEAVVTSQVRRDELINRGHERLQEFSWAKCASQTMEVYQSVL